MKIKHLYIIVFILVSIESKSQKYTVDSGTIEFFSHAAIEDIKAYNKKVIGVFNVSTQDIVFSVPISNFQFEKSLMKEHFNEKYMESEKFPKSTFQGKIINYDISRTETQEVKASGKLTIHGVTRDINISGIVERQSNKLLMKSKFVVKPEDYKIEIPQLLWNKIAEQVEVTLDFVFKPQ
jgi:polyisoprenoid-binding protein YceI